ncbi:MAG TPA: TonB-dependent receptor [Candidatus Acidoferrales bacterium]|nr:TonB-dependent receptor [Candidatus Acidoferrales bacterium]
MSPIRLSSWILIVILLLARYPVAAQQPDTNAAVARASVSGTLIAVNADGSKEGVADVAVNLIGPAPNSEVRSTTTDADGAYLFSDVAPGNYTLEATKDGFKPWTAMLTVQPGQTLVEDAVLQVGSISQQVEVRAEVTPLVATHSVSPAETVSNKELAALPLPTQKFTEALSLLPGVLRTSEGKLSINGQSESQGMLLVDSAENVDPISGSFSIPIPVDAIQTMTVHSLPESSAYGGFSGGVTIIDTKAPSASWDYKLLDFPPSFRGKNGELVGIENWTPRFQFGGPLVKNKINFSQEVTYEFRRTPVRGLAWPLNETTARTFTSFTEVEFILSPRHLLNVNLNVFPSQLEYANLSALVPQTASADYRRKGASVGASDSYQFVSGAVLSTVVRFTRFDSDTWGQGPGDMLITPVGWAGNFFNNWSRRANQLELQPALQLPEKNWHGRHQVRFGEDVLYRSYRGSTLSHPVDLLAADGLVAERIDFQGTGLLRAGDTEAAEFIEEQWNLNDSFTLNYGARLSSQSIGRDAALAPRAGIAFAPGSMRRTVIRASAAEIYSHVPLLAADFADNQERLLSFFDPSGALVGAPVLLQNAYLPSGIPAVTPATTVAPETSPRTFVWNAEFEREVRANLSLRVGYLENHTNDLFILDPQVNATTGNSILALRNTGASNYRRAEVAAHYRPAENADLNISYTWSRAQGDLNTLSDTLILYAAPVIRPNAYGILPSDVPHRVVASGVFRLPWKMELSPVVDIHSGFPYSNVDVLQNYVGVPDSLRFPTYFSMDARIYREINLHVPFTEHSKRHKVRIGVYSTNLTNHQNAHDVYSNVTSPYFGIFTGIDRRVDGMVLDLVQ